MSQQPIGRIRLAVGQLKEGPYVGQWVVDVLYNMDLLQRVGGPWPTEGEALAEVPGIYEEIRKALGDRVGPLKHGFGGAIGGEA